MNKLLAIAATAAIVAAPVAASAATLTASATGISNSSGGSNGTHQHSNLFGVDNYGGEEGRGIAEFDLTGVGTPGSATFTFTVSGFADFYSNSPYAGTISLFAYSADNTYNNNDYEIATFASLGSFSTVGANIGDAFSVDVTSALQQAVSNNLGSFGIKAIAASGGGFNAVTFGNLAINADEVPEPAMLGLFGLGAIGLGLSRRRRAA